MTTDRLPQQQLPARPGRGSDVRVVPVTDADLAEVGRFLGAHMPPDTAPAQWADAWRRTVNVPGSVDAPNHGFLLRHADDVVGVYLAMYSTRMIDGRQERFCSLAQWCVLPDYRIHSLRLARALLGQPGWHFTDIAPDGPVQRLNQRLGFARLDTTAALVPHLPWPTWPGRTKISADPAVIARTLTGEELRHYRDHAHCAHVRPVAVVHDGTPSLVMFRRERRYGLPLFASIVHASNPEVLRRAYRPFARFLLLRYGILATIVELRIAGGRLRPSLLLRNHRPKMYRSATLGPDKIDYLYSELTCAP